MTILTINYIKLQGEEIAWDKYATDFCNQWEEIRIDLSISEEEKKPLLVYILIDGDVIEENQLSSYLECCRVLDMECFESYMVDEDGERLYDTIQVDITDVDTRVLDFDESKEKVIRRFLNLRYSLVGEDAGDYVYINREEYLKENNG